MTTFITIHHVPITLIKIIKTKLKCTCEYENNFTYFKSIWNNYIFWAQHQRHIYNITDNLRPLHHKVWITRHNSFRWFPSPTWKDNFRCVNMVKISLDPFLTASKVLTPFTTKYLLSMVRMNIIILRVYGD